MSPSARRLLATATLICLCLACSSNGKSSSGTSSPSHVAPSLPAIVDSGPAAAGGTVNMLFVSVTVCAPGSTTLCQTIDHVQVDTGSTGFRVFAEVLGAGLATSQLPQATDGSGNPLVECTQFADGYSWGPVKTADLALGGATASSVPIQVIGDPTYASLSIPEACSSYVDVPENTVADFGANGLLGIGNYLEDCGSACATGIQDGSAYNSCPSSTAPTCQPVAVQPSSQVQNPGAVLATDNDGVLLQLPAVAAPGSLTIAGSLVFGVGTASNNGLGSATPYTLDSYGSLATSVSGVGSFASSYIDSGSNGYFFDDAALPPCTGGDAPFYCPVNPVPFSATLTGMNGATGEVAFTVDDAAADFNTSDAALPGLAASTGAGLGADTFDWGLPFFYGRPVYVVFEGKTASGSSVAGPYIAF